jgi:hypothetical protein|nr:MAG TPA: hypothetical protein [Caudoviricetes sp.]
MLQELNQEQYFNDVTLFIKRIECTVKEDAISYTFETIGEWYFPLIRCTMKGGSLGDGTIVEEATPDQYLFVGYRRPGVDEFLEDVLGYSETNRVLKVSPVETKYKSWSKLKSLIEPQEYERLRNTGYLMALVVVLNNIHRHYRGDNSKIRYIIEDINKQIATNLALLENSTKEGEAVKKIGFFKRLKNLFYISNSKWL